MGLEEVEDSEEEKESMSLLVTAVEWKDIKHLNVQRDKIQEKKIKPE